MVPTMVWFRRDLRLDDNPALAAAAAGGRPVVPVYVYAPDEEGSWRPGAASRWWLHHSLVALAGALRERDLRLILRHGPTLDALRALLRETGAQAVHWNRLYEPSIVSRDRTIKRALRGDGIEAESHNGHLLHEPWTMRTGAGDPYRVFTPFWKACLRQPDPPEPKPAPGLTAWSGQDDLTSLTPDDLDLLPRIPWDKEFHDHWQPGERSAQAGLERLVEERLERYGEDRDRPDRAGTSRLSPHLHFGEMGPRQVWHAVQARRAGGGVSGLENGAERYLDELGWREFAHHVLFHHPDFPDQPLNERFADFPWRDDEPALAAWQAGCTGIPMVDAGMRELWRTGWMHNRVRMVVGSLLVKNLRQPWQAGERWFWDTLVDADLANNSLGWQWVMGSGADAAPFFRIFNPVRQGERFDPDGAYVARWVPEVAELPARYRYAPWEAPADARRRAGLRLGECYPEPIVDLKASRRDALAAFERIKRA